MMGFREIESSSMKHFCLTFLFLLAACAAPEPVFTPVEVAVPVAVPCRAPGVQPPESALQKMTAQNSLFDKTRAALVELDVRKAYEARLQAALAVCGK